MKYLRLIAMVLLAPMIYLLALFEGIWDWICGVDHVWYAVRSAHQQIKWTFRETLSPGIHLNEELGRRMPIPGKPVCGIHGDRCGSSTTCRVLTQPREE